MSTVYLAIQLSVGREVALKVMSPALNADPVFSERFQREANIVGQLSHPNIVAIYDIGRYKNLNYIAMDYLPGGSVHDKMANGLSTQEALRIIQEIANSLDHAHEKGYIHRDIKPENILFREDGTSILSDFGVAKTLSSASQMTNAGTVVGTPHYMSPEQARGKPIDGRSDIYGLGVVFFEILTGSVPYRAEEAVAIAIKHLTAPIPTLPPQHSLFQPLLNKLLAKNPDDRYQRGREVVEAIDNVSHTLSGNSTRYLTDTDPTSVQIFSLFKALLLTSYAVLAAQLKELGDYLFSWRWSPKRGAYRHPKVSVTEIHTSSNTADAGRATVVSTRVQKAAHYQAKKSPRLRWGLRASALSLLLCIIWGAFSIGSQRYPELAKEYLPSPIQHIAERTATTLAGLFDSQTEPALTLAVPAIKPTIAPPLAEPVNTRPARPELTAQDAPQEPPSFAINVALQPENASVRILNIRDKYYPGIKLLPGRYHIEVTDKGYDTQTQWITLNDEDLALSVSLRKTPVPGAVFHNQLGRQGKGPAMVIVPAGSFSMGKLNQSETAPVRRVRFQQPFAVSQYEITFADFDKYSQASDTPKLSDNRWGRGSRPAINMNWQQAQDYVRWLRKTTGRKYRLLSEAEWEYIARAQTESDFWWKGRDAKARANCRRGCESEFSGLFRTKTAPVGSYTANRFKIFDSAGNVAEWVDDCYKNHYMGAPKDGSAVSEPSCTLRVARGGSIKSSAEDLASHARDKREPAKGYSDLGFRVAVELY